MSFVLGHHSFFLSGDLSITSFRINLCKTSIDLTQVRYQSPSIQRTFYLRPLTFTSRLLQGSSAPPFSFTNFLASVFVSLSLLETPPTPIPAELALSCKTDCKDNR